MTTRKLRNFPKSVVFPQPISEADFRRALFVCYRRLGDTADPSSDELHTADLFRHQFVPKDTVLVRLSGCAHFEESRLRGGRPYVVFRDHEGKFFDFERLEFRAVELAVNPSVTADARRRTDADFNICAEVPLELATQHLLPTKVCLYEQFKK